MNISGSVSNGKRGVSKPIALTAGRNKNVVQPQTQWLHAITMQDNVARGFRKGKLMLKKAK